MSSTSDSQLTSAPLADRYRIERELGRGGMATVFLARDLKHDRDVAIKVLDPEVSAQLGAERFVAEIRLTANLQHANILPLFDSGSIEAGRDATKRLFYVMPFVAGETLRARTARERVPVAEGIAILRDIARALAYAHGHGVVHRDIKPENVLLAGGAAVVADFGIAKAINAAKDADRPALATTAGISLGTPAYMAPEQALGDAVDARADIYAWGVVAYEALAGAHPFAAHATAQRLVAAHVNEMPAPLGPVQPAVPPDVAALVMQCLAKDPAHRPSDATELVNRLSALTTPLSPPPASRTAFTTPAKIAMAIAAVAVAGLGAFAVLRGRTATPTPPTIVVVPFLNQGDPADALSSI
jgi:eukaryotic-like serine/threonine-protein kinase